MYDSVIKMTLGVLASNQKNLKRGVAIISESLTNERDRELARSWFEESDDSEETGK